VKKDSRLSGGFRKVRPLKLTKKRSKKVSFYLYLLLGFLGGIPAGMGMGGGTVTIPLLTLIGGVEQKIAQAANLFSFLPMSIVALKKHRENGLLRTDGLLKIALPAVIASGVGAFLIVYFPAQILRKAFGGFLVLLAIFATKNALKKAQ
jgi:uncharacterized membrane protein YfcA